MTRNPHHSDVLKSFPQAGFNPDAILRDLAQTGTPESQRHGTDQGEGFSESTDFYLGKCVVGSEALVEELTEVCPPLTVIQSGGLLVLPLMPRHSWSRITETEATNRLASRIVNNPVVFPDATTLRLGEPMPPNPKKFQSLRVPFHRARDPEAYSDLKYQNDIVRRAPNSRKNYYLLDGLRVAEHLTEQQYLRAAMIVRRSSIINNEVVFDRVAVCEAPSLQVLNQSHQDR